MTEKPSSLTTLAVPSSDPVTRRGGPRRNGQQLFTMSVCSPIFFTCKPVCVSQARVLLSGEQEIIRSPSGVQCNSSTAFLWPADVGFLSDLISTTESATYNLGNPAQLWAWLPQAQARILTFYNHKILTVTIGSPKKDVFVMWPTRNNISVWIELHREHLPSMASEQHYRCLQSWCALRALQ